MIKNTKFSLSLINSSLLLIFLIIISATISFWLYISAQKVINKNIDDYFNQTYNLTSVFLESEQKFLNNTAFEISNLMYFNNKLKDMDIINSEIENLTSVEQIDLLYLKENSMITDYSNSLFDTGILISEIEKANTRLDNFILDIKVDNEVFLIMISAKKILDKETGRVKSILYAGKIFNDNFSLLNNIKEKAKLKNVCIYMDKSLIATTSDNKAASIEKLLSVNILRENDIIYGRKSIPILNGKKANIIFVIQDSSFDVLKKVFLEEAFFLLIFMLMIFGLLYFFSNKFIIAPFSKLLDYAHEIKNNSNVKYEKTRVVEFDKFAYDLKSIINEIKELKEQYSRAIDGVQDGLWDVDIKSKKVFQSSRYLKMLGYEESDKINTVDFWFNSIHKEDHRKIIRKLKEHFHGKNELFDCKYRLKCKDGTFKWIKIRGKLFFNSDKKASSMTGFHTDINDLVLLKSENDKKEQMLYQQSKLAAMGEMIGNIAHQWRQPLNVISTIASTISMDIELEQFEEEEALQDLQKLVETVQYLSTIIEKFRHFFNPNKELEEFVVSDMIKSNLEIFESSYKSSNVELILHLEDVNICGYKFELMQVIINIINNAKDALVENIESTGEKLIFMSCEEVNEELLIKIHDNAGGIPQKVKEKIYEPYFTTKHQSQGTGLGLYMSNEIIQKHFKGTLTNETITYEYEGKSLKGEEFLIKVPKGL